MFALFCVRTLTWLRRRKTMRKTAQEKLNNFDSEKLNYRAINNSEVSLAQQQSMYLPNILSRIASDSMCMALGLFLMLSNLSSVSHSLQFSYAFIGEPNFLCIILLVSLYLR